jgi:hypothetical protein
MSLIWLFYPIRITQHLCLHAPNTKQLNPPSTHIELQVILRPADFPFDIIDADFLVRLLVIFEPLALLQVDASKLSSCLDALGQPFTLTVR